jgi:hypothetical protein
MADFNEKYRRNMFLLARAQAILLSLFWPGLAIYLYQIIHRFWNVSFAITIGMFQTLFAYFGIMSLLHVLTTVFLCRREKWAVRFMSFLGLKYFGFSIYVTYKTDSPFYVYPIIAIALLFLCVFLWSLWITHKSISVDEILTQKGFEPVMKTNNPATPAMQIADVSSPDKKINA